MEIFSNTAGLFQKLICQKCKQRNVLLVSCCGYYCRKCISELIIKDFWLFDEVKCDQCNKVFNLFAVQLILCKKKYKEWVRESITRYMDFFEKITENNREFKYYVDLQYLLFNCINLRYHYSMENCTQLKNIYQEMVTNKNMESYALNEIREDPYGFHQHPASKSSSVKSQIKFFCSKVNCNGIITKDNVDNVCNNCGSKICERCLCVVKEEGGLKQHQCDETVLKSIDQVKASSKPCPQCRVPIYQISGCYLMWCSQCHTSFDWRTQKILKVSGSENHNPHFIEHLENNINNVVNSENITDLAGGDNFLTPLPQSTEHNKNEIEDVRLKNSYVLYQNYWKKYDTILFNLGDIMMVNVFSWRLFLSKMFLTPQKCYNVIGYDTIVRLMGLINKVETAWEDFLYRHCNVLQYYFFKGCLGKKIRVVYNNNNKKNSGGDVTDSDGSRHVFDLHRVSRMQYMMNKITKEQFISNMRYNEKVWKKSVQIYGLFNSLVEDYIFILQLIIYNQCVTQEVVDGDLLFCDDNPGYTKLLDRINRKIGQLWKNAITAHNGLDKVYENTKKINLKLQ